MFFFSHLDVQLITYNKFANNIPSQGENSVLVFVLEMLPLEKHEYWTD